MSTATAPTAGRGKSAKAEPHGVPAVWPHDPLSAATTEYELIRSALSVLAGMLGAQGKLVAITQSIEQVRVELGKIRALNDATAVSERVQEVMKTLHEASKSLLAVDAGISLGSIKKALRKRPEDLRDLKAYGRLLMHHAAQDRLRWDRLNLLCTRLLTAQGPNGQEEITAFGDAEPLLAGLLAGAPFDPQRRAASLDFFSGAQTRLEVVTKVDSLFDTNLFDDIRRFKIVLGTSLYDPAVMHRAAQLNLMFSQRLRDLMAFEKVPPERVELLFNLARQRVEESLKPKKPEKPKKGLSERYGKGGGEKGDRDHKEKEKPKSKKALTGAELARDVASRQPVSKPPKAMAALFAILMVAWLLQPGAKDAGKEVSKQDLRTISSYLTSGTSQEKKGRKSIIAQVHSADWIALQDTERESEKKAMAKRIKAQGFDDATILRGNAVVLKIEKGKVLP